MKVGDKILVTRSTASGVEYGIIGKIATVVIVDTEDTEFLPYIVRLSNARQAFWVSGVPTTELIEELC